MFKQSVLEPTDHHVDWWDQADCVDHFLFPDGPSPIALYEFNNVPHIRCDSVDPNKDV